jgi:cathepsin L|eukprot:TRINITY_DN74375_c0_g1_i1.p1 TRINITY_DN74375_c0_g1~~TRINITY_DN74375_c0_g1_i1.p1  ORF type:complete len:462 (-),score=55.59 TRINITY_DN74375_c0_g1_i1:97-1431(-)
MASSRIPFLVLAVVPCFSLLIDFDEFLRLYGRKYEYGSQEYADRRVLFETHVTKVQQLNNINGFWRAGINNFADRTVDELSILRGYKRTSSRGKSRGPVGFMSRAVIARNMSKLPENLSWRNVLNATKEVQDQGPCGSCWAFASATVLRAHSELFRKDRAFSVQQIISCTTNPKECGGQGGCHGATAELAMDYVLRTGCAEDHEVPYEQEVARCPSEATSKQMEPNPVTGGVFASVNSQSLSQTSTQQMGGMAFGMLGWKRLPENQLEPVLWNLYEIGPLVVSLQSGQEWNMYDRGIFDVCDQDAIIDHAVMLVGYGIDAGTRYWLLQNSWGPDWGEDGFIRILRHDHEKEKSFCGWDTEPNLGSGCNDGPSKVRVCGHCGLLNDVVIPSFALTAEGWWSRNKRPMQVDHRDETDKRPVVSQVLTQAAPVSRAELRGSVDAVAG